MKTHVAGHVRQNTGQCHNQPSQTRKNLKNDTVYMCDVTMKTEKKNKHKQW